MSDIPMGSPPVPPGRHAAPGGWYADPVDNRQERYWDGWQWSRNVRPREGAGPPQPGPWPPRSAPSAWTGPAGGTDRSGPGPGDAGTHPALPAPARAGLLTADGVPVSSWWWRALAAVLDSVFVGVVALLLSLPLYRRLFAGLSAFYAQVLQGARVGGAPPVLPDLSALVTPTDQVLIALVGLGVGMAYQVGFLRRRAATPGKIICGLRVVPVDQGRCAGPAALVHRVRAGGDLGGPRGLQPVVPDYRRRHPGPTRTPETAGVARSRRTHPGGASAGLRAGRPEAYSGRSHLLQVSLR